MPVKLTIAQCEKIIALCRVHAHGSLVPPAEIVGADPKNSTTVNIKIKQAEYRLAESGQVM